MQRNSGGKISIVSDQTLLKLHCIFGSAFERGLELYEAQRVTCISIKDEANHEIVDAQWLLEVKSFSGEIYILFPYTNFCSCWSFRCQVLKERSAFACKHVLAAWLATINMEKLPRYNVTHSQFKELLLSISEGL